MSTAVAIQERIQVEEITSIMTGASTVLAKNENLVTAAANKGQGYLDTIEAEGINDAIDAELNEWQLKAKNALQIMNDRRAPITQLMTKMAKVFTEMEGRIDPKKPDSIYTKIQNERNAWAKVKVEEQQRKEAEIRRKQAHDREVIDIKAKIEQQVRDAYLSKLYAFKSNANLKLNSMTLETVSEVKEALKAIKTAYPREAFMELPVNVTAVYLDSVELSRMILTTKVLLFDELSANFRENMEAVQQQLLDTVPSKVNELKDLAKASESQRKAMEEERIKREQEESDRLKREAEEDKRKAEQQVNLQKEMDTAGTLFDAAAELSEVKADAGQVKQGYKINVLNVAGWGAVFMFYFDKAGQKMTVEEFGKKTLNQMKSFCEKHALATGEFIDSKTVVYEAEYKAVTKKGE